MGKAMVLKFGKAGAKVVVADVNEEEGSKVVEEIKSNGGEAIFIQVDVSDEESVKNMVQKTVDTSSAAADSEYSTKIDWTLTDGP